MLAWDEEVGAPGVRVAVTDRHGGVSAGAYGSLNLGDHVGDDPAAVAENRRRVAAAAGVPAERLLVARQVHGADVVVAEGPWEGEPPAADALVTRERGLVLAVLVADCVPVLLAAPGEGVVAVAHAGRQGLARGVVPATLAAMRRLGARSVVGRVGPSICARHYEVPAALRDEVDAQVPGTASVDRHGHPALDLPAGVLAQAARECREVDVVPGCSVERPDLYSYRRDGTTGRYAGLAWLEA